MNKNLTSVRHPAWRMFVVCCLIQFGCNGCLMMNLFTSAICQDMGFSYAAYGICTTILSYVSAVVYPIAGRKLPTMDNKTLALIGLLGPAAIFCTGFCTQLWQFYILAAIRGFVAGFYLMMALPVIINKWFVKARATVLGIALAMSGISGPFFNTIGHNIISSFGWRTGVRVTGLISFVIFVPAVFFVLRCSPEKMGVTAYGSEEGGKTDTISTIKEKAVQKKDYGFLTNPIFYILILARLAMSLPSGFTGYFTVFGTSIGQAALGATLLSCYQMGNTAWKLILGVLVDKLSMRRTQYIALALVASGVLLVFFSGNTYAMMAGAFIFGANASVGTLIASMLVVDTIPAEQYATALGVITTISSLMGGMISPILGGIYDATGSFTAYGIAIVIGMVFLAILLTGIYAIKSRQLKQSSAAV